MKALIILFLSISAFANEPKVQNLVHTPEQDFFYGKSNNVSTPAEVKKLDQPIVSKDECLIFKKAGETFWNKYESEVLKVKEIGKTNLKVSKILFVSKFSESWAESESFPLGFDKQLLFEVIPCPKEVDQIPAETLNVKK